MLYYNFLFGYYSAVRVSQNFNEKLSPCTLDERLKIIDNKVPLKNNTAKQLNSYLKYIAHLHHNKYCKPFLITKERKARWVKHASWICSSAALAPVFDKPKDISYKKEHIPSKYTPPSTTKEIKSAVMVDYIKKEPEVIIKKEKKVEKAPLFDFEYNIIEHIKGNSFLLERKDTKYRLSKKIPAFVRDNFNPRNPFYPHELCIDAKLSPLKELLEEGKAFYSKSSSRYHITADIDKEVTVLTETIKQEDDEVVFNDVFYDVVMPGKTLETAILVHYRQGIEEEYVEIEKTLEKEKVLADNQRIVEHIKGNKFKIIDEDTKRCFTKTLRPFVRENFNPKNPFYPNKKCSDWEEGELKRLLDNNQAFYNDSNDRYYRLDPVETEKINKINKVKKHDDEVTFEETTYEIDYVDSKTKNKTKKEHDLEWKTIQRNDFANYLIKSKEQIIFHNKFACLKPNKKLSKYIGFKLNKNIDISEPDRDFCRSNKIDINNLNSIVKKEEIKELELRTVLEETINNLIKEKVKVLIPKRTKYLSKKKYLNLENAILGLQKGFLSKKEYNTKKCFREVAFRCLDEIACSKAVLTDFKLKTRNLNLNYDDDNY